jgi:hypothetical protein
MRQRHDASPARPWIALCHNAHGDQRVNGAGGRGRHHEHRGAGLGPPRGALAASDGSAAPAGVPRVRSRIR